jgi:hypothetical protein
VQERGRGGGVQERGENKPHDGVAKCAFLLKLGVATKTYYRRSVFSVLFNKVFWFHGFFKMAPLGTVA